MNKDMQSETLYGPGGDNPKTLNGGEAEGGDNTLKNMAEMMSPAERKEMLSILQSMEKKDRMSGDLSIDEETPTEATNEPGGE